MKRFAFRSVVSSTLLLAFMVPSVGAMAAKKSVKAKPAKAAAAVPNANAEEIAKLKGEFKWGMPVEQVQ